MEAEFEKIHSLKYKEEETIINFIQEFSKKNEDLYDTFLKVLEIKSDFYTLEINSITKTKLVQTVILSIIMSSVSSSMSPDINQFFRNRVKNVADSLDLNFKDVIKLTSYEQQFLSIFNDEFQKSS